MSQEHGLTPRQVEIVRLLSLGCTVKETARLLGLAPSTVDNHRARAMETLGTDKAVLLARLAMWYGITTPEETLTPAEKRKSGRPNDGWN
ncbi:MAG: helix-turn-helix transcriptional regulator [Planctomycetota bacterium]